MLDVGGLSLGLLKVMPLFKVVNAIGSSYFPERTINILVLNAPRVFQQLWAIVRASPPPAAAGACALTRAAPLRSCKSWWTRARKRRFTSCRAARTS